jgi:hypothetical protein
MQASILKLKATLRSLKTLSPYVGFEVLKAMVMKNYIFWDITRCSALKVKQRFGGTRSRHLQGRSRNQSLVGSASHLLSRWLLTFFLNDCTDKINKTYIYPN